MRKIYILLYSLFFILNSAFGQGGIWTWISGDNTGNSYGVFGIQGVPSVNNHPPALYEPCEWKDKQGNFWIYSGEYSGFYSDLWKFNPMTKEWTWMKGNGLTNQLPVYGSQGVPDPANTPGNRPLAAASWVDTSGVFWLFGGEGCANDLWKYDTGTNEWTWMKGSNVNNAKGIHGIQGTQDAANTPGARYETSSAWTDSLNNLWLFGGDGYDDNGNMGLLNDICKYNISANEWTWVKGSAFMGATPNYGTKGVANMNNDPGARFTYNKWKDAQGNFWIMGGGLNYSTSFNDTWKYDITANEWTWMNGTTLNQDPGQYHAACSFDTINLPCSRSEQRSSVTDNCGRFWLLAGAVFNSGYSLLSDTWVYDPQQLKWSLINGNNVFNQAGNYGTLGTPSASNMLPSRMGAVAWWGNDNQIYIFGGWRTSNYYSDLWVFNPDTNCIRACNAVTVIPPVANFQSGKTTLCAYDCVNYTNLSANATSWQWSFAGGNPAISTDKNPQNVCYTTPGMYNVTLVASNAGGSDSITFTNYINVTAAPPTPVITQHHDTLICGTSPSYTSYQWYMDSTIINGATDTLLIFTHGGNYNIKVTDENGCSIAGGITVGIKEFTAYGLQFTVSPNPVTDELLINGNWQSASGKKIITIFNMLGEIIFVKELNSKQETVNCKLFSSGIYFVQIANDDGRWIGKFIKE